MKNLSLLLLLLTSCTSSRLSINGPAVNLIDSDQPSLYNHIRPGDCYSSAYLLNEFDQPIDSQAYVLEIVNPLLEKYLSKITPEELAQYDPKVESYKIKTKETDLKYIFNIESFLSDWGPKTIGYKFCVRESRATYVTISKEALLNRNTRIERTRIIGAPKILKIPVSEKPKELTEFQYYRTAGLWTELRNVIVCQQPFSNTVSRIKKSLNNKGYDLEINEVVDFAFKTALIDFQQKNGLPEGNLDLETMKALGVSY